MTTTRRRELGCPGHFIAAAWCHFRRHTQVPGYRISTVGDYRPSGSLERVPIGGGEHDWFETAVFRTTGRQVEGHEGCGCEEVATWARVDGERYMAIGDAQAGHERMAKKWSGTHTMTRHARP